MLSVIGVLAPLTAAHQNADTEVWIHHFLTRVRGPLAVSGLKEWAHCILAVYKNSPALSKWSTSVFADTTKSVRRAGGEGGGGGVRGSGSE